MNSIRAVGIFIAFIGLGTALAQSPSPATKSTAGATNTTATGMQTTAVPTPSPEPKAQAVPNTVSVATSKENPIHSDVAKDWMDKLNWALTAILVVIGALGVRYAKNTLKAIDGQLTEIRAAGKQTDQMLKHAGVQAEAAKASAEALIHSERAWVVISKVWPPNLMFGSPPTCQERATTRSISISQTLAEPLVALPRLEVLRASCRETRLLPSLSIRLIPMS